MKVYSVKEIYKIGRTNSMSTKYMLFSSAELARKHCENYILKNIGCTPEKWYWLHINEHEIDNPNSEQHVTFYDWHGEEITSPPLDGYEELKCRE